MVRGAIKIGVSATTGGLLDGSVIEGVEKDISGLLADQVDAIVGERLKHVERDRLALEEFRLYLSEFVTAQGQGRPVVFIIDELDLPSRESIDGSRRHEYLKTVLASLLSEQERYENRLALDLLDELCADQRATCRDVERIATYLSLMQVLRKQVLFSEFYQLILAYGCFLKVLYPDLLRALRTGDLPVAEVLKRSGLQRIEEPWQSLLVNAVVFSFADQRERMRMAEQDGEFKRVLRHWPQGNPVVSVARWLGELHFD